MIDIKCKLCESDLFPQENTIGKPLEYDICQVCWEELTDAQRKKYIEDGCVPITRFMVTQEWKDWCAKYDLRP